MSSSFTTAIIAPSAGDFGVAIAGGGRMCVRARSGRIWVLGSATGASPTLRAWRSDDSGASWTEEIVISDVTAKQRPCIAIGTDDQPVVGFSPLAQTIKFYQRDSGGVWNARADLITETTATASFQLVQKSGGSWFCVYGDVLTSNGARVVRMQTANSIIAAWGTTSTIDTGDTTQSGPADLRALSATIDRVGVIHIAYCLPVSGTWRLKYANVAGSTTIEQIKDLGSTGTASNFGQMCSIALDKLNVPYIVCSVKSTYYALGIGIVYFDRVAGFWTLGEAVHADRSQTQQQCWIGIEDAGSPYVVWAGQGWGANSGSFNIQYAIKMPGFAWTQVGITDLATGETTPAIVHDTMPAVKEGGHVARGAFGYNRSGSQARSWFANDLLFGEIQQVTSTLQFAASSSERNPHAFAQSGIMFVPVAIGKSLNKSLTTSIGFVIAATEKRSTLSIGLTALAFATSAKRNQIVRSVLTFVSTASAKSNRQAATAIAFVQTAAAKRAALASASTAITFVSTGTRGASASSRSASSSISFSQGAAALYRETCDTLFVPKVPIGTSLTVYFLSPFGAPTLQIAMRRPEFGNELELDVQVVAQHSRSGALATFKRTPTYRTLRLPFEQLTRLKAEELRNFLEISAGNEVRYIDHENRNWRGVIVSSSVPIKTTGRGRITEANAVELMFEGSIVGE